jgi:hypothetical protein
MNTNSSRQGDNDAAATRYGASSSVGYFNNGGGNYNVDTQYQVPSMAGSASRNYYSGVAPSLNQPASVNGTSAHYNNYLHSSQVVDKAYSIINTEPVLVRKDRPLIIVDPILETYVKSYLTWSLFNLIFCWVIGGIVTTLMSCKVMQLNDDKQFKAAFRLADKVLLANMIITGVGVFLFLVFFPYIYIAIYPSLPKINW